MTVGFEGYLHAASVYCMVPALQNIMRSLQKFIEPFLAVLGRVYPSKDTRQTWNKIAQYSTNIGTYAFYEDPPNQIWIGKDFLQPDGMSLWRQA